jgi:uroporphyrin-III C-methyltransferase/precorrin-2 dehydrogenase/sirohydrochlorin ferrochelatase/precorrin-2 dehydrogenase/sirohydrochlorin ferrochelatase
MVAYRKVRVLCDFGAKVTVTAPKICAEMDAVSGISICKKEFEETDVEGMTCVVAATDCREKNHAVSRCCRQKKIPVNAVDQPEDCDFIFPSYCKEGDVVAAFSSGGKSPVLTQYLREQNRGIVTEKAGEIADLLGEIREEVKSFVPTEEERKQVYRKCLSEFLLADVLPDREHLLATLKKRYGSKDKHEKTETESEDEVKWNAGDAYEEVRH